VFALQYSLSSYNAGTNDAAMYRAMRLVPTNNQSYGCCSLLPHMRCTVLLIDFLSVVLQRFFLFLYNFQIFIKTLTGRKQALNFEPENQVLAVKQALQEKEGIQVDQIKLIHSGKQLADDKTLESYNIAAGATIHMVLQLRGGAM
jgi:hypothetical protein